MRAFCCTTDVVTRQLPVTVCRYPAERQQLLELMRADQEARMSGAFQTASKSQLHMLQQEEDARASQLLKILRKIQTPSVRNVGLDGSRAVWLLALHNPMYRNAGITVLGKMRRLFYRDKQQVFYPGIPYLVDRLMITAKNHDHNAKQLYGTQRWRTTNSRGLVTSGRFPIIKPRDLGARLRKFDLAYKEQCEHSV